MPIANGRPLAHLYTHSRWRSLRKRHLAREPLCHFCEREGKVTLATVVDHIEPHRGDVVKFWAGPFMSLCKLHHDSDKQAMEKSGRVRRAFGLDGEPL